MQTLGQKFKAAREAKGLTVEGIASGTRINAAYLRALESDDRSAFPGAFFYRSFIRQYAQILDLPEASYRAELERSIADQEKMLQELPSQLPERKLDVAPIPTGSGWNVDETKRWALRVASLALVLLVCTGIYELYVRWQTPSSAAPDTAAVTEPAPAPPQPAVRPASVEKKAPPPAPATQDNSVPAQAQIPPPAPIPASVAASLQETARPGVEEPKLPAAAAAEPAATGSVRVRLTARELCWVDSWKGTQHYFSNALQPGQTQVLMGIPGMRVLVGNAGGVEIEFNGRVIPPAGPRGQVRTLEFNEGTYRVVSPPPKTETPQPQTQN